MSPIWNEIQSRPTFEISFEFLIWFFKQKQKLIHSCLHSPIAVTACKNERLACANIIGFILGHFDWIRVTIITIEFNQFSTNSFCSQMCLWLIIVWNSNHSAYKIWSIMYHSKKSSFAFITHAAAFYLRLISQFIHLCCATHLLFSALYVYYLISFSLPHTLRSCNVHVFIISIPLHRMSYEYGTKTMQRRPFLFAFSIR